MDQVKHEEERTDDVPEVRERKAVEDQDSQRGNDQPAISAPYYSAGTLVPCEGFSQDKTDGEGTKNHSQ